MKRFQLYWPLQLMISLGYQYTARFNRLTHKPPLHPVSQNKNQPAEILRSLPQSKTKQFLHSSEPEKLIFITINCNNFKDKLRLLYKTPSFSPEKLSIVLKSPKVVWFLYKNLIY